jgi:hypothetical protein
VTVTPGGGGGTSVTVKMAGVLPVLGSVTETSLIARVGPCARGERREQ